MPEKLLRTYGRRKGHKLSPHQANLLDKRLPELRIDTGSEMINHVASLFPSRPDRVWLEIGFGGGEHLLWQATNNPDVGIIGCEPFINGVARLISGIDKYGLENVRIFDGDVRQLLPRFSAGQIEKLFILFPDPWPKKRHWKRRLISPETLREFARIMAVGAELRIASDIDHYIQSITIDIENQSEFKWLNDGDRNCSGRNNDWPETRYEYKAKKEGRIPVYLRFQRV